MINNDSKVLQIHNHILVDVTFKYEQVKYGGQNRMAWVCPKCGCGNIDEWKNCKRCDTPKIILR